MKLWQQFLDLLFPPKCPFCQKIVDTAEVCAACEATLPWTRASDIFQDGSVRCVAPLWYDDTVREGFLRFKFQGAAGMATPFGKLIAQCAAEHFAGDFDIVTWVPVSKQRLRKRGYDQAELLAQAACRIWRAKPVRLLEKSVHTPAQSGIQDESARRANVLGVYQTVKGASIAGRRILLIDDICTTGATLTECVRVLKEAGAADVVCAAVALARREKVHNSSRE